MEAATRAAKREYDLAIATSWHTAIFAVSAYSGKLKGKKLSDYLSDQSSSPKQSPHAQAIAFFHRMKSQGVDVQISRNEVN